VAEGEDLGEVAGAHGVVGRVAARPPGGAAGAASREVCAAVGGREVLQVDGVGELVREVVGDPVRVVPDEAKIMTVRRSRS